MKELAKTSLKSIGQKFGDRDHTTVIYAVKEIKKQIENNFSFKESIQNIMLKLGSG